MAASVVCLKAAPNPVAGGGAERLRRAGVLAGLAQLVEQRFCKPKVAGSSPASGTILRATHASAGAAARRRYARRKRRGNAMRFDDYRAHDAVGLAALVAKREVSPD